ncbi:flagellar hook-associated protein FlgL [Sanguibacter antarcticus]|uniref:Flagellar hook-associated protein 3 FlgL n=1 Tax=Sanguibacter antarcticus TaxID=372484 RepID=A0A2A9DZI6_9MICO|nr:flagellar hook-associated protein FlgL [Sanguibacter antarcticus]PFG32217.1 flagellar hook-associated protein 3 FlgL [Sanguibacter antarcticus]
MITRVTHQSTQRMSLANMQANLAKMSDLQSQASSGKLINKASDDPAKAAEAMALRKEQRATEQYARNAQDGVSWLNTVDSAIQSSVDFMQRARDLTVQGANTGAIGAAGRDALAVEIEGIRDALLGQANTTYIGRSVFAGTANGSAFTTATDPVTGDVSYTAATVHGTVERRVGENTTVRVDADGAAVFGDGAASVFSLLTNIAADLRNPGVNVSTRLTEIDSRIQSMLSVGSSVGARTNQLTAAQDTLSNQSMTLASDLSGVEDIDLAQTIIELQMQEVGYKAALGAAARVLQPSLMDYLQ